MSETLRELQPDVAIVGCGPTGLFAAYYAGMRGLRTVLVDALPEPGGQISAMYPEKEIFDVAGFPAVRGRDLVARLVQQADRFHPTYVLGQRAVDLARDVHGFRMTTSVGTVVRAKVVIVAGGIGHFSPRPLPPVPGLETADVAHFVPEPAAYSGRDVVVVGGGDSALDWATTLAPIARSVAVVHRRSTFRGHESSLVEAERLGVRIIRQARVASAQRSTGLDALALMVHDKAEAVIVPCQAVVAALGFTAQLGPLLEWGIDVQDRRRITVSTTMATSLPGVFAAGDITTYDGKVPLIAVGFAEAATAVNNACTWMMPEASLFPGHSTDQSSSLLEQAAS